MENITEVNRRNANGGISQQHSLIHEEYLIRQGSNSLNKPGKGESNANSGGDGSAEQMIHEDPERRLQMKTAFFSNQN